MKNSVILVTENFRLAQKIKSKLILLRKEDCFDIVEPENCIAEIRKKQLSIVLFHLSKFNEEELFDFLQKARQSDDLKNISIILLYDNFSEDILCSAFELGITDFVSTRASETELTVRTIWALQKHEKNVELKNKSDLLKDLRILDEKNDIFTENYTYAKIKKEITKNVGTFVAIAPDINTRNNLSPNFIIKTIKNTIRTSDTIGFASDFKFYLWLKNTDKKEALIILDKIQKKLAPDFSVSAGYIEVNNKSFENIEKITNNALSKALLKGCSFIYAEENNSQKILDKTQKTGLQEKVYSEHLENILSPIFYQYQKRNEEKLFETKIKQSVNKEKSYFKLENENGQSSLFLTNKKSQKTEIEILHNIVDMEIKAEKITFSTNEIKEEQIESYLKSFIKDFQKYTNC